MSGIKSTPGGPPPSVDSFKGATASHGEVAPITPSSPSGGQSGPAIPQASSVSTLSEGSTIPAIVTARAKGGDTMLHAEIGNFRMSANSQLPVGSYIVLEIEAIDDVIIARLISINGEKLASPPSVTLLPTLMPATTSDKGYLPPKALSNPEVQTGLQNLTATLGKLSLPISSQQTESSQKIFANLQGPSAVENKSVLANKFFTTPVNLQDSSASKMTQSQSLGTAAYAHTHSPGQKPSLTPSIQNATLEATSNKLHLPDITDVSRLIVKATIQRAPLNQAIMLPSGPVNAVRGVTLNVIVSTSMNPMENITNGMSATGTVIAVTRPSQAGMKPQVHVQTDLAGTITYSATSTPQIGSKLNLTILENMPQFPLQTMPALSTAFKLSHLPIMNEWENLGTALNLVATQNPELAQSILNSRIPSANTQLGSSLLFLLTALNLGNMDKWLGQDFRRILDTGGHRDLLKSLDDEFSMLVKASSDPGGQDWKALAFPFFDGEALRQLKLFYRRRENGGPEKDEESTRFVIELDLSKTGPVQLDGLFNKSRFDLVFRSQLDVPEDLKHHVFEIFTSNLEITGILGSLVFKRTIPFPVHPTEDWENSIGDIFNA